MSRMFMPILTNVFNHWFAQETIHNSITKGMIILLLVGDLIRPEQNYAVTGRSIQKILHPIHKIIEGIEDDTDDALISLDQSKAFDKVDHRFLAVVLETAGFEREFRKWINTLYHNPQAVVQVNGKLSGSFVI